MRPTPFFILLGDQPLTLGVHGADGLGVVVCFCPLSRSMSFTAGIFVEIFVVLNVVIIVVFNVEIVL